MICPRCSRELDADSIFCPHCSLALGDSAAAGEGDARGEERDPASAPVIYRPVPFQSTRYRIVCEVGRGGMGVVYLARDLQLEEEVALKILHPQLTADPQSLERFKTETRLARRIAHPNVIRVHDLGDFDGVLYISMEYFPGSDLRTVMRSPTFDLSAEGKPIIRQLCAGLQAAHQLGIVHRDVKPQNVLVAADGTVKVGDFGIARWAEATDFTTSGLLLGTPNYMSPEQVRMREVDHRSDLYSVGVILYEMFTGSLPFEDRSPVAVAIHHLQTAPDPPSRRNPNLPPSVDALILRALAKEPEERFPDMESLWAAVEALELPAGCPRPLLAAAPAEVGGAVREPTLRIEPPAAPVAGRAARRPGRAPRRRVLLRLSSALAAAALLSALVLLAAAGPRPAAWAGKLRGLLGMGEASGAGAAPRTREIGGVQVPGAKPLFAQQKQPGAPPVAEELASLREKIDEARRAGDLESALRSLQRFILLAPEDATARREALECQQAVEGDRLAATGELEGARQAYRRGLAGAAAGSLLLEERLLTVDFPLAERAIGDRRFEAALALLEEAERLAPSDDPRRAGLEERMALCRVESLRGQAQEAETKGDLRLAHQHFEALLRLTPEDAEARAALERLGLHQDREAAEALYAAGRYREAQEAYTVLAARGEAGPEIEKRLRRCRLEVLRAEARGLEAAGSGAEALARWRLVAELDPAEPEAAARLARADEPREPEGMVFVAGGELAPAGGAAPLVAPFFIDRYEVTCRQYQAFVRATGHAPPGGWEGDAFPSGKGDHPVIYVSWHDAAAYARWAGKRLPQESEWEVAACGGQGWKWPWGNSFDEKRANTLESGNGQTTPVGIFSLGASPAGAHDLSGNVWEWTASWASPSRQQRVVRGGAWNVPGEDCGCASRSAFLPGTMSNSIGFRCALDAPPAGS